jgi:hypothetical protein
MITRRTALSLPAALVAGLVVGTTQVQAMNVANLLSAYREAFGDSAVISREGNWYRVDYRFRGRDHCTCTAGGSPDALLDSEHCRRSAEWSLSVAVRKAKERESAIVTASA